MTPDDPQNYRYPEAPNPTPGGYSQSGKKSDNTSKAATDLIRQQIDNIYHSDPNYLTDSQADQDKKPIVSEKTEPEPTQTNIQPGVGAVSFRPAPQPNVPLTTETKTEPATTVNQADWQKYHSAWQSYYQQYYERYYMGQVYASQQELDRQAKLQNKAPMAAESISSDEALTDLKSKLRQQITKRAKKVRSSRHFIPILAAAVVMLAFLFLQYNRTVFAAVDAYVSPGNIDPATLIVDPNAAGDVSADPKLIIPKINVNVPIIWDAVASSESSLNDAMNKGVAWFNIPGANAKPGEVGNFVLSGHSSNDWLDPGDYKFIFARLEQLSQGDTIYVDYNSTRYVYSVSRTSVVQPTDVAALTTPIDKPEITLVTCTPLGTALNRLLVFADQVSPDPSTAAKTTTDNTSVTASQMPANSPTFLQRLFGAR